MNIEPLADNVPLNGPDAPKADTIDDLIQVLVTIRHRFGNTAVSVNSLKWGASALWADTFDLSLILAKQAAWSKKTFGGGKRTKANLAHIRKELLEIEAKPDDLKEWIDVAMLAFDGAWRHGHRPWDVAYAYHDKLQTNMARKWPPPVDENTPVEHIRG